MSLTGTPASGTDVQIKPGHWLGLAVVLLATVAVYAQMYGQRFIYFDDNLYVFENAHVATGLNWENIKWAFTSLDLANWHPLTMLSHQLDCTIFGLNAGAHKLVSLAIHLGCVALVFLFFARMTRSAWAGLFIAAAFALHPVNVEAVAWVSQRKTLLSTLFAMASLLAYLRYAARPSVGRYLAVCLWLALSLMCKPMGVTTPILFLILDFWPLGRLKGCIDPMSPESYKPLDPASPVVPVETADSIVPGFDLRALGRLTLEKAPMLLMTALICGVTLLAQRGAASSIERVGVMDRVGNALLGFVRYLKMAVWPGDLAVLYPIARPEMLLCVVALGVLGALTYIAWRLAPRYPYVMVGWLWYLVSLVPVIGLVQVGSQSHADRYAYTPLLGIWLVAALGIPELMRNRFSAWRGALGVGTAAFLLAISVNTWVQVGFWADTKILFLRAALVTERNYTAYSQYGKALMVEKHYPEAVEALAQSLEINGSQQDVYGMLATGLMYMGRPDVAQKVINDGLKRYPEEPDCLYVQAKLYAQTGRPEEALKAVGGVKPATGASLQFEGMLLLSTGRPKDAISALEESERITPGNADTAYMLALALLQTGKTTEALAPMKYAAENRRDRMSLYNLGMLYETLGQTAPAREVLEVVCRQWPDFVDARLGLAGVLIKQGETEKAGTLIDGVLKQDAGNARAVEMKGKLGTTGK